MFGGTIISRSTKHQFYKSPTKSLLHLRFPQNVHTYVFVGSSRVRKRLVLNLPPCHVTAVQQQPADGQLTARGKGLVCDKKEA